eukprot:297603-Pleurochrysis_carterae.AAC.1
MHGRKCVRVHTQERVLIVPRSRVCTREVWHRVPECARARMKTPNSCRSGKESQPERARASRI